MKRSSQPRSTAELSKSLNRQLNTYALAAGAAGVGLLALAQPAEAKIVYTPAHGQVINALPLDLNHDGMTDFYLVRTSNVRTSNPGNTLNLTACQSIRSYSGIKYCSSAYAENAVRTAMRFAAALRYGAKIQHSDRFANDGVDLGGVVGRLYSNTAWLGPWFNGGKGVKNRYLGLKFKIKGKFHFGWARLTVKTTKNDFTATLTGYAYETIPGKAIIAGQTQGPDVITVPAGSLGRLALGRK